jgi:hypothetical protein
MRDGTITPEQTRPGPHDPEYFDIVWRNASVPEAFDYESLTRRLYGPVEDITADTRTVNTTLNLTPGSLFSFQVVPWHRHNVYSVIDGQRVPVGSTPVRPPSTAMEEALFLTDISVGVGHGAQGGMLVSWDNPLFNNQQVFSGYRIDFRDMGSPQWETGDTVSLDTPGLSTSQAGRRWSYEFTHQNLQVGRMYEARIVPLVGTTPIYNVTRIPIGAHIHHFAFSGRDYMATGFYLRPGLTVRPEGLEYLTLMWSLPTDPPYRVTRLQIWSTHNPPPEDFEPNFGNATLVHTIMGEHAATATTLLVPRPEEVPIWYIVVITANALGFSPPPVTMLTNSVVFDPIFNDFIPYSPTIHEITHTGQPGSLGLNVQWRAFTRPRFRDMDNLFQDAGEDFISGEGFIIDNEFTSPTKLKIFRRSATLTLWRA